MFGYVVINKPELKVKEFYEYKAFYCGLCRVLKNNYGQLGQMTLSYDMTFLIILLTSLYECDTKRIKSHCVVHPVRKQETLRNEITDYVADMNIALTYHHLMDDWQDERSILGLTGARALQRGYKKVSRKYPEKCGSIRECLNQLKECEDRGETNIDMVSRCFGELMAELFTYKKDRWENNLRKIGFYLGKFIYILDAYDDIEKDMKNNSYNPFLADYGKESFYQECGNMLTLMIAECSREFEQLPCVMDITILRNILYEGVWNKYNKIQEERMKRKEQSYDSKSISGT